MKLIATMPFEYVPNPDHYPTSDPEEMAKIDEANFNEEPSIFLEGFEETLKITVRVKK